MNLWNTGFADLLFAASSWHGIKNNLFWLHVHDTLYPQSAFLPGDFHLTRSRENWFNLMACSEYHHSLLVVAEWLFLFHTSRYAFGAKKGLAISFFFTIPGSRNNIQVCWSYQQYASFSGKELLRIPLSRNYREIGYKLAAQRVVGSFGWTSVTTSNWLVVAVITIHQS